MDRSYNGRFPSQTDAVQRGFPSKLIRVYILVNGILGLAINLDLGDVLVSPTTRDSSVVVSV